MIAEIGACSGAAEPGPIPTLALVSGADQTVTVNPSGLTPLPLPVVMRVQDGAGSPVAGGDVRAAVWMAGAPGPNGSVRFQTGPDGIVSMQLYVSNIPGRFRIDVYYERCVDEGLFGCDRYGTLASLTLFGTASR